MNIWDKMQQVDRRIIYAVFLAAIVFPLLNPIGMPLSYSDTTISFYNEVEKLQAGDVVCMALDYSPGGSPDVHPQAVVVTKHLLQKGVKMVFVSFWAAGPMYAEQIIQPYIASGEMVNGENVANLGYISGGSTAIRRFGLDVAGTQPRDFYNKETTSLPIMKGIKDCRDFALVIEFNSGSPGLGEWVQQVQGPLGVKILSGSVTVNVPTNMPYVDAGQVIGLLQGLRGAAEYEVMSGNPGSAVAGMDAQSLGHIVVITFIILGNLGYFITGRHKKNV
ncbi:MAG: hypothetical protein ACOX2K_08580 [Bacillota bacterium]|jgi:hypothetical protein